MSETVPIPAVKYWTHRLRNRYFGSAQEARNEVFRIVEHQVQNSWFTPVGQSTSLENRRFAAAMPLFQEGAQWRVGLAEYASMTSDFSDGTGGGPYAGASRGDKDAAAGLPDYKFYERRRARRDKLKQLLHRRDPDGSSATPEDVELQQLVGESRDAWFAGSAVVDDQGRPLVVYHSSPNSFRKFDTSREGAHFGTHEQASNLNRPGKREPKAYLLAIKNPLRLPDAGVWSNFNNVHALLAREDIFDAAEADRAWAAWLRTDEEGWQTLKDILREKGYDGAVYQNEQEGPGDSYLAFSSDQVRPVNGAVKESEDIDNDFDFKDNQVEIKLTPTIAGVKEHYTVTRFDQNLGTVFKTIPRHDYTWVEAALQREYPWVSSPGYSTFNNGRHRSRDEAVSRVVDTADGQMVPTHTREFHQRHRALRKLWKLYQQRA